MFTQAAAREKKIAIRSALGARRARLIWQLLTETVPLALLGSLLGWLLASWGLNTLLALLPADAIPAETNVQMDGRVLWFALGMMMLTTMICGLLPALRFSRADVGESLKDGARTTTGGLRNRRLRHVLVVTEVALSVVLLIGAGLLVRSFQQMQRVEVGFDREHLLTLDLKLPEKKYAAPQQTIASIAPCWNAWPLCPASLNGPDGRRALQQLQPGLPLVREGEVLTDMQEAAQKPFVSYIPTEGAGLTRWVALARWSSVRRGRYGRRSARCRHQSSHCRQGFRRARPARQTHLLGLP